MFIRHLRHPEAELTLGLLDAALQVANGVHLAEVDVVYEVLDTAMRAATPFSCYHRVIDRQGREHSVLLVGRGVRDDRGLVEKLEG